jgi:chemotaxis protein methyltransferase CheR
MSQITLSDKEFTQFQKVMYDIAEICMPPAKKPLVCGRLDIRAKHYALGIYGDYFNCYGKFGLK